MIKIELVNDDRVAESLRQAAQQLADTAPLMAEIGARLEASARQRFDTKTDPAGVAWAPLSLITPLLYELIHKKPLEGSLMERSGNLRDSIESHVLDAGRSVEVGTTATVTNKSGTTWHLGGLHEFGTRIMPRRGIIFGQVSGQGEGARVTQALGEDDLQDVLDVVRSHVERSFT